VSQALSLSLGIAVVQGMVLHALHRLAESGPGGWSELQFLLPAYAVTVGVPLTWHLLSSQLPGRVLARRVAVLGLALVATGAYVGWVNGAVGDLRPAIGGSVLLFGWLTLLAWFVALPFLRLGIRGSFAKAGYVGLFDEAWRLAITLAFAALFVGLFWSLLSLFVALFKSLGISWPQDVIFERAFYYPATCAAASFAIGLTDVKPDMFRGLRHLLLGVLRWLTVLCAVIVLVFLGAILVEGVSVLWKTHLATASLIALSIALITLYNAVYQDGGRSEALPVGLDFVVRAALIAGPTLAALAVWAVVLRLQQHGVSEDRLHILLVIAILSSYLVGYCIVALMGARAPFEIRHVNVVMALVIVAALILVHTPLLDFKRIAVKSQVARVGRPDVQFDFNYLRHNAGRHGILALQSLVASGLPPVVERARSVLAEPNRREFRALARTFDPAGDRARLRARVQVYPRGRLLPDELIEHLLTIVQKQRWQLACIDAGPPCTALLIDLDRDGREEAVMLAAGQATVYAPLTGGWTRVGRLMTGRYPNADALRAALEEGRFQLASPPRYLGLEIGTMTYAFVPDECDPANAACP
jgi:hypothetical protein